jgi:predicted transcriptional regulator
MEEFKGLGKLELEIMHVIWDKEKATVQEVKDALSETHHRSYSTFLTLMRRMEKKGFLRHEIQDDGRTYVYKPAYDREEVSTTMLWYMYLRLFRCSSERLMDALNALFRKEQMTPEEIQHLKKLIAETGEQVE